MGQESHATNWAQNYRDRHNVKACVTERRTHILSTPKPTGYGVAYLASQLSSA